MVSKLLIGVTGQRNARTRAIVVALNEKLNLININMRQPFIDVLAVVAETTPQIAAQMSGDDMIKKLKCKVSAFEREFMSATYGLNKDYFIETAENRLINSTAGFNEPVKHLFDGHIVSGISRPQEAKFIRDRGGVMVHLQEGPGFTDFHPIETKLYDVIYDAKQFTADNKDSLALIVASIKESHRKVA